MARPSKTTDVLSSEGKSHRTKAEIQQRKEAEKALATGKALVERPEVRASEIAHREFLRINRLLMKIEKNDAMYEPVINRYCILQAECAELEKLRDVFTGNLEKLEDSKMDEEKRFKLQAQMQKSILDADRQIQSKRKMMFDIEKECAMTISAAMRSIPKAPAKEKNPLLAVLVE